MDKKQAFDYVTEPVNYARPQFNFPDLSSKDGNPFDFFPIVAHKLKELGFKKEAEIFDGHFSFMQYKFEDMFPLISKFLDFDPVHGLSNEKNILKEDEDYVYIKIKKGLYSSEKNLKQPTIFKISSVETFNDMIDEDFSVKNCYGRTFLHYIDNPSLMKAFLESNRTNNWVDLIDLDNFNGSYMHTATNIECFSILLEEFTQLSPAIANTLLFGSDSFGKSAFSVFTGLFTKMIKDEQAFESALKDAEKIVTLTTIFRNLEKINKDMFKEFQTIFKNSDLMKPIFAKNPAFEANYDKMFMVAHLDNILINPEDSVKHKTKKI